MFEVFLSGKWLGDRPTFSAAFALLYEKAGDFIRNGVDATLPNRSRMEFKNYLFETLSLDYHGVCELAKKVGLLENGELLAISEDAPEIRRMVVAAFIAASPNAMEVLKGFPTLADVLEQGGSVPLNL